MATQFKKANEDVEQLEGLLAALAAEGDMDTGARKERIGAMQALLDALTSPMEKMHKKAAEKDPDKALYGPKQAERVLALHARFVAANDKVDVIKESSAGEIGRHDAAEDRARVERLRAEEEERKEKIRLAEEKERLAREEEARRKAEEERKRLEGEEREKVEAEKRRVQREQRDKERVEKRKLQGLAEQRPKNKWEAEPVGSGDVELTIELALQMEEEGQKLREGVQFAMGRCEEECPGRPQFRQVLLTIVSFLNTIIDTPRERKFRRIRFENPLFHEKVGQYTGGVDLMIACGFEDEYDVVEDERVTGEETEERILIMNRVVVDNLTIAVQMLTRTAGYR